MSAQETSLPTSLPTQTLVHAAHAEPVAARMDLIFIEGFVGETVIGIHESELHKPQPVVIDVQAGVQRARACDTDRIHDTIDYSVVCERLRRLLVEHRLQLLEAFAETIATILIDEFGASWVRVKVVKPKKFSDVSAVGCADRAGSADRGHAVVTWWCSSAEAHRLGHGARRPLTHPHRARQGAGADRLAMERQRATRWPGVARIDQPIPQVPPAGGTQGISWLRTGGSQSPSWQRLRRRWANPTRHA